MVVAAELVLHPAVRQEAQELVALRQRRRLRQRGAALLAHAARRVRRSTVGVGVGFIGPLAAHVEDEQRGDRHDG